MLQVKPLKIKLLMTNYQIISPHKPNCILNSFLGHIPNVDLAPYLTSGIRFPPKLN